MKQIPIITRVAKSARDTKIEIPHPYQRPYSGSSERALTPREGGGARDGHGVLGAVQQRGCWVGC